jgi:hypothetical protein
MHYIERGLLSSCLVLLGLLIANLAVASDQQYCGTKHCSVERDAQGNYYARFSCTGAYPVGVTCTGIPAEKRFFEQDPARVQCDCPSGRCGAGSTIAAHLECAPDNTATRYSVNCMANGFLTIVAIGAVYSCCVTCDTNPSCPQTCDYATNCNNPSTCGGPVDYCLHPVTGCQTVYVKNGGCCVKSSPILIDIDSNGFNTPELKLFDIGHSRH